MNNYILITNKSKQNYLAENGIYPSVNNDYYLCTKKLIRLLGIFNTRAAGFGNSWAKWDNVR